MNDPMTPEDGDGRSGERHAAEERPAVQADTPAETEPVRFRAPAQAAAGIPGVARAVQHLLKQMPVAEASRAMRKLNQMGGIDCMSCAWPESDHGRHMFEFCENGAKAVAWEATTARATPAFFSEHSIAQLSRQSDYWLGQQGRITEPLLRDAGATHYQAVSWEAAFDVVAEELAALSSPEEAVFYTSGRTSNEAAFLYQLFVRQFGTNNLPDCSNMCHESSGVALSQTIGIGKGTVTLDDFEKAQVILILGQNPGTNHPRMLTTLEAAKKRGAKIVAINPLPEAGLLRFKNPQTVRGTLLGGTALADVFLQVRIGGDMHLLQGICKALLERGAVARDFVRDKTTGFEAFAAQIAATPWEPLTSGSGIAREQIDAVAALAASTDRIIACWAMGLTQHKHAVGTIQEIINLLLLRGAIGKPGAGACPVRGHSNVQGDRTMGIWEKPPKEFLDALAAQFHFSPPRTHGLDAVESIHAMREGRAKVFFALGGNFLSASPDTLATAEALQNTRMTAHVSLKLNRSHLITGRRGLILPALGRTEIDLQNGVAQFVSTENSMGVVAKSQGVLQPAAPGLLSEVAIVCRLAQRVLRPGGRSTVDWAALAADYDRIRDAIARTIPGFEEYNQRVRQPAGFHLPNGPRRGDFSRAPAKAAAFTTHALPSLVLPAGQLAMMTVRSHDQFNTTIYGNDDIYRGITQGRRVILLNVDDLKERGMGSGDLVDITSCFAGQTRAARGFTAIAYPIPRGCAATYFPEANVLVPLASTADGSNTPSYKYVPIVVEKARGV